MNRWNGQERAGMWQDAHKVDEFFLRDGCEFIFSFVNTEVRNGMSR